MGSNGPVYATQADVRDDIEYTVTMKIEEKVERTYDDVDSRDEAVLDLKRSVDGISGDEPFERVTVDGVRPPFHVTAIVQRTVTGDVEASDAGHAIDLVEKDIVRDYDCRRDMVTPMEVVRR